MLSLHFSNYIDIQYLTQISIPPVRTPSGSWNAPPWILKTGCTVELWLNPVLLILKYKKIAFFVSQKILKKWFFLWFSEIFPDFFLRIGLDWRSLVELRSPNIEKRRGFFLFLKNYLLRFSDFFDHFEFLWIFWL